MKKLRLFKCDKCQEQIERLVSDDTACIDCICGGLAQRQITAARYYGNGADGKSPSRHSAKIE
jgi:hypothetical protein